MAVPPNGRQVKANAIIMDNETGLPGNLLQTDS
jgi:hypothetical protein